MTKDNTKHTPGPWVIDNRSVFEAEPQHNSGRRAFGDVVAECPTAFSGHTVRAPHTASEPCPSCEDLDARGLANAHLIASAPALLDALRELVRVCIQSEVNHEDYSAAVIDADCAIAKAEGREVQP